jgi:hypothetical protein
MITIKSKNTQVLESSLRFTEDGKSVKYQANTDLYVEGNTYTDLVTPKTIFDLICPLNEVSDILEVTQKQIDEYITNKYPPIA